MILEYNKFLKKNEGIVIGKVGEKTIDKMIDDAYKHFKSIKKPVNSLDIMNYVEEQIGKEMDDDDFEELYYKISGENLDSDDIEDLDDEEKFIVK